MTKKPIKFDFEDGRGPVPAHQHINPDKSIGGWVADSVEFSVEAKVFIAGKVRFSGYFKTTFLGGDFLGGTFLGGDFLGGTFRGGDFLGGTFRGGTFRGGDFLGGDFRGGDFWGGDFLGGDFRGGTFRGGDFWGGTFWGGDLPGRHLPGGTFRGGDFLGGTFRGGDFLGGTFLGGTFRGGTFRGGDFRGGDFRGGIIKTNRDFIVFASCGSRDAPLTVQFEEEPLFTTGCQSRITMVEFTAKVKETHGNNVWAQEYRAIIACVKTLAKIRKAEKEA